MRARILKGMFLIIMLAAHCYAYTNPNKLLDIGILTKKGGKAVVLIFDRPTKKDNWRIRFNDKKLDVELYNFISVIEQDSLNINIPGLKKVNLSQDNNNIRISFLLEESIKELISNGLLTFLTKIPNMLGIMFTQSYINRHSITKSSKKLPKEVKYKQKIENIKKESVEKAKQGVSENMDMPFVKYEEILATNLRDGLEDVKKFKITAPDDEIDLFKIIASFSVVLGVMLLTLFLWKKFLFLKHKGKQDLIRLLSAYHFGSKQSIAVVQVGEEKFLLGITPENITLLTKLNKKDFQNHGIRELNLSEEDTLGQKVADILKDRLDQLKRV